jgi:alcohol dehydrogenase
MSQASAAAGSAASFEFRSATRLVVAAGGIRRLGLLARDLGMRRALVVSDEGVIAVGHTGRGVAALEAAGLAVEVFSGFTENPTTDHVTAGVNAARGFRPDGLIGIGGGSSMDCAKGINFLLSCGGRMQDYRGRGEAGRPLLPMIGCPTTAGTGSETQSFALISDAVSGEKMACGDPSAAFRIAMLDVELTLTQPQRVTALTGIDALSHALESHVCTAATPASRVFSREAWRLLAGHLPRVLADGDDLEARQAMQLGAAWAGLAIENAMLGAAHASANPLTASFHVPHGQAVGLMLPHVVRLNATAVGNAYAELSTLAGLPKSENAAAGLADWLVDLLAAAGLQTRLRSLIPGVVPATVIPDLAAAAAAQWTGRFNPRTCSQETFAQLYEASL